MITMNDCRTLARNVYAYVEETLASEERAAMAEHLRGCAKCRRVVRQFQSMEGLLKGAYAPAMPGEPHRARSLRARCSRRG